MGVALYSIGRYGENNQTSYRQLCIQQVDLTVEVDLTYNKVDVTNKSRGCYKWVEITTQGFGDSTIYGIHELIVLAISQLVLLVCDLDYTYM